MLLPLGFVCAALGATGFIALLLPLIAVAYWAIRIPRRPVRQRR